MGSTRRVSAALGTMYAVCSEWWPCWRVACRLVEGTDLGECCESSMCCELSISFFYFIWGRRWEGSRAMLKNTEGELLGFWENNWCCFHSLDLESPLKQLWLFFPFLLKSVMVASFCICFFFLQLERELCLHPDPGSEGDSGKLQQLWVRNECGGAALAGFI